MGNNIIEVTNCENHLGLALANDAKAEEKNVVSRISQCKAILYSIKAIGSQRVPVTPVTSSKLYNDVCVPKLLYGCEIMNIGSNCQDKLEEFHCHAAKNLQGLPDVAANPASLASIGWNSITTLIDTMRLMFLWRILLLPMTCLYKVLLIRRIVTLTVNDEIKGMGPTHNWLMLCKKYNVLDIVINAISSGEYMCISEWKRKIKPLVQAHDIKRWKVTCSLYKSLRYVFLDIGKFTISPWWQHAFNNVHYMLKSRCIIQLLIGKERQLKGLCHKCNANQVSVEHILFYCNSVMKTRNLMWEKVESCCLPALLDDLMCMSTRERLIMILNGFNVNYVIEWQALYNTVADFICNVYQEYVRE